MKFRLMNSLRTKIHFDMLICINVHVHQMRFKANYIRHLNLLTLHSIIIAHNGSIRLAKKKKKKGGKKRYKKLNRNHYEDEIHLST